MASATPALSGFAIQGPDRTKAITAAELGANPHRLDRRYMWRAPAWIPSGRKSDGLQDLLPGDVRCQDPAPVGVARQHLKGRAQRVIARTHAGRGAALFDRLHRLAQQTPHLDDRLVGRSEMLLAAVDDAPHALLDCAILHVDPVDPGEALGPLHLAIDQIVILPVRLGTEGRLIDMQRSVAETAIEAVLVVERFVGPARS